MVDIRLIAFFSMFLTYILCNVLAYIVAKHAQHWIHHWIWDDIANNRCYCTYIAVGIQVNAYNNLDFSYAHWITQNPFDNLLSFDGKLRAGIMFIRFLFTYKHESRKIEHVLSFGFSAKCDQMNARNTLYPLLVYRSTKVHSSSSQNTIEMFYSTWKF